MPSASPWVVAPSHEATDPAVPEIIGRLLAARGILDSERFFHPTLDDLHDPSLLLGMEPAVARILRAVRDAEAILIYGDYDVDGTTATVLLKTAIERLGPARVSYHVPHRLREGYGMQSSRLAEAKAEGVRLVISVDTGIRAFAAADEAKALGLDLIVTDHHLPDGDSRLPEALAVINPAQPGCPYPNKNLCGAAVAFKLAHALLHAGAETQQQKDFLSDRLLRSFLKLVAIATIADSVELTGENRAIVALGLEALANPVQPGLRALMQVAGLAPNEPPSARSVGWGLAPRINAAGRMDVASDVVELFLTRSPERAGELAGKLDTLNQERRATEAAALETIESELSSLCDPAGVHAPRCLVLHHPDWHRGVLGILASRVVDRTGRPALVLTTQDGDAHGSGRSVKGFHLLDALTAIDQQDLFHRFGGHAHAVGFSLPLSRLPLLRERLGARPLATELLAPALHIDLELSADDLSLDLARWLARMEPFGHGHEEPVLLVRGLVLAGPPRTIKQTHICLPLQGGINAMGWSRPGAESWADRVAALPLEPEAVVDAVFYLRENRNAQYGGLELVLIELAMHGG